MRLIHTLEHVMLFISLQSRGMPQGPLALTNPSKKQSKASSYLRIHLFIVQKDKVVKPSQAFTHIMCALHHD
jgi:hypothetical protein